MGKTPLHDAVDIMRHSTLPDAIPDSHTLSTAIWRPVTDTNLQLRDHMRCRLPGMNSRTLEVGILQTWSLSASSCPTFPADSSRRIGCSTKAMASSDVAMAHQVHEEDAAVREQSKIRWMRIRLPPGKCPPSSEKTICARRMEGHCHRSFR